MVPVEESTGIDGEMAAWLLAVCVHRLGGKVTIREEDDEAVEGAILFTTHDGEGVGTIHLARADQVGHA